MRLSRRGALGLGLGGAAAFTAGGVLLAGAKPDTGRPARQVVVAARPIPSLLPSDPERRRFGALTYRSGLVLSSPDLGFGGYSGLWRSTDGRELVSLSDRGDWLTANAIYDSDRLAGLGDAAIAPILDADGRPVAWSAAYDTESLAIADGTAFVGSEHAHEVRHFEWAKAGVRARGQIVPVPPELKTLPANESLEALAVAPPNHPLAGGLIAIAERARPGDEEPTRGWVLTGSRRFAFDVRRSHAFDVTDLAFLPSGEALLLERRFRIMSGVACRIRRLAPDVFRADALVDGEIILEADRAYEIDNMEGIAVHRDPGTGQTIVTLVSDDNFSFVQRTLLLEFALNG